MKRQLSVLFVCTGNTCRSPLAEVMMKSTLREAGVKNVTVSSAGTAAVEGVKPSKSAALAAGRLGVSLSGFRSRPLTPARVHRADLILTMALIQKEEIVRRWPSASDKTFVISEFSGSRREAIEDPIGQSEEAYFRCAGDLCDEVRMLLPRIQHMVRTRGKMR